MTDTIDWQEEEAIEMKICEAFLAIQDEHNVWISVNVRRGRLTTFSVFRREQEKKKKRGRPHGIQH